MDKTTRVYRAKLSVVGDGDKQIMFGATPESAVLKLIAGRPFKIGETVVIEIDSYECADEFVNEQP